MIASLPMYWRAENAPIWHDFWALVQRHAPDLPGLTAPDDLPQNWADHWLDPELALSMTCGLPLRTLLKGKVTYVGTLTFGDCAKPGHYRSVMITRQGHNLSGPLTLAYNAPDSQSGWAASHDADAGLPQATITNWLQTGAHASSMKAVAEGQADIAFLDEVTWRLLQRFDPLAQRVQAVGHTTPTPALPLITAKARDPLPLRRAVGMAARDFRDDLTKAIGGKPSFTVLTEASYFAQPVPPAPPH